MYPAQNLKNLFSIKYAVFAFACILSSLFSFSQTTMCANTSNDLISFTAQSNNSGKIMVSLITGSEINTSYFMIQRSFDGINFDDAALIFSEEDNANYVPRYYFYNDNQSFKDNGSLCYRIKIVDLKGDYKYSDTVKVKSESEESDVVLEANPKQSELRITIPQSWKGKTVYYEIYNEHEGLIKQKVSSNAIQTETLEITDLPVGRYMIKASNGSYSSEQRIVKLSS
jgi:hypothetical protein